MATSFHFDHTLAFDPADAEAILRAIPAESGVFALFGPGKETGAQPYLSRTADLRRRMRRLLNPPESMVATSPGSDSPPSRRLNLSKRVAHIEYTVTGSEFASSLVLYYAAVALFDYPEARRRLKLHTPFFVRFAAENDFPRLYVTNRLSRRSLAHTFGPFPSRPAAERYCDAILDLFKLRRCYEDLSPSPQHPGCVYQEMNKCLAPCNQALTPEERAVYSNEATAVLSFLSTRGESLLAQIATDRDRASAEMDFETAAALHTQHQRAKAAASLADEIVRPIPDLRAVIVQPAALSPAFQASRSGNITEPTSMAADPAAAPAEVVSQATPAEPASGSRRVHTDEAAVFLLSAGCIIGPKPLSTLGVRAVKEQTSVGSSLFAQPLMLQAVSLPADDASGPSQPPAQGDVALNPEARAQALLLHLEASHTSAPPADVAQLSDHLSLLRRWYYRPEKQRTGELFLPNADGQWPVRRILRGAARMALGDPAQMAETDREAAKAIKAAAKGGTRTKVLHAGRPDVERIVSVAPRHSPADIQPAANADATFQSRRKQPPAPE